MLAESDRLVTVFEVFLNLQQEVIRSEDGSNIWVLCISFISWVDIVVFFSADWSPFFKSNQDIVEDFLSINFNKSTIAVICDTTTIVALSN